MALQCAKISILIFGIVSFYRHAVLPNKNSEEEPRYFYLSIPKGLNQVT